MSAVDDQSMAAARLLELIDAQAAPVVVDVRSPCEFDGGHVPGAINIPFWAVPMAPIPATVEDRIVVYCGHGPRAVAARIALGWRGFRHVAVLSGHMSAWHAAGLREETPPFSPPSRTPRDEPV
jgi:rhodanese-related sulfurtransferase